MNNYKVYLPSLDISKLRDVYIGHRHRRSTATAVRIIGDKLVTAHFLGRMLYLLDMQGNALSQIPTVFETDLMDCNGPLVACAHLFDKKISLFNLNNNRFSFYKFIGINHIRLHGIKIKDNQIAVTTTDGVVFVDILSEKQSFFKIQHQPKDVLFRDDLMVVPISKTDPQMEPYDTIPNSSQIFLYKNLKLIDKASTNGQPDAICMRGDEGWVTMQDIDSLCHFELKDNRLRVLDYIPGFYFPHGIDCNEEFLAVTNYGDNSIDIIYV